jgi:hypothetical protein
MPNGTSIQSSQTSDLLLSALPHQARKSHIFTRLVQNSLISVGQLYNSGCDVTFTREKVGVTNNGQCVMSGQRDPNTRLWKVNLKESMKPEHKPECNHVHDNSNQKYLMNYLNNACLSPVKSTWIQAIKNGNFTSWSGLTE